MYKWMCEQEEKECVCVCVRLWLIIKLLNKNIEKETLKKMLFLCFEKRRLSFLVTKKSFWQKKE